MAVKCCKQCNADLPLACFGKDRREKDGLNRQCRECRNTAQKQWNSHNKDKVKASKQRSYRKNWADYKRRRDEWNEKNPTRQKEMHETWRTEHRDQWRTIQKAARRRLIERDPERAKARAAAMHAVGNELRMGRLQRQLCSMCGAKPSHAHHHLGYAPEHWLDITWLCASCHKTAHAQIN
jgi:hypothetical protein